MRIGVPTEIKNNEGRVALTPAGVRDLVGHGHTVTIQAGAGTKSSISDDDYRAAGAHIADVDVVWSTSELVMKVKEPIASEYHYFRSDLTLFTYLHLAADAALTEALLAASMTSIAYETIKDARGGLPLLAPMSEIAGRLAVHAGIYHLQASQGGRGVLASGVPGVAPANVLVIGGGVAGLNAARQAVGVGAKVTILDVSIPRLREIDDLYGSSITTIASSGHAIEELALEADLIIGAVLLPGAKAPTLVPRELVARLRPGTVLVDIAIDQGGCIADSHPTSHDEPTYKVGDSLYYCVANMPGAVPVTSTRALTNATLPFARAIANLGWRTALETVPGMAPGLSTFAGAIVSPEVAAAHPTLPSNTSPLAAAA